MNLSKIMFFSMLCMGTMISISSNSWTGAWSGLEINLLSMIPLMTNKLNLNNSEASLNYFLVQALASAIILFSIIIYMITYNLIFFMNDFTFMKYKYLPFMLITLTLMLKVGAAPFHFWFPNVMENISWDNNLILMTWQKIAPMMIMSYLMNLNNIMITFVLVSTLVGSVGGFNQTSLRKLMAFSSINHMGWMIMSLMYNENLWLMYFMIYSFLNFSIIFLFMTFKIYYLNQSFSMFMNSPFLKFYLFMTTLSLGGLPPFLGFLIKWLVIQSLMFMKMMSINLFIICMSLITLFYYLKISFSAFMFNYSEFNWSIKNFYKNNMYMMLNLTFYSLFSLLISMELIF